MEGVSTSDASAGASTGDVRGVRRWGLRSAAMAALVALGVGTMVFGGRGARRSQGDRHVSSSSVGLPLFKREEKNPRSPALRTRQRMERKIAEERGSLPSVAYLGGSLREDAVEQTMDRESVKVEDAPWREEAIRTEASVLGDGGATSHPNPSWQSETGFGSQINLSRALQGNAHGQMGPSWTPEATPSSQIDPPWMPEKSHEEGPQQEREASIGYGSSDGRSIGSTSLGRVESFQSSIPDSGCDTQSMASSQWDLGSLGYNECDLFGDIWESRDQGGHAWDSMFTGDRNQWGTGSIGVSNPWEPVSDHDTWNARARSEWDLSRGGFAEQERRRVGSVGDLSSFSETKSLSGSFGDLSHGGSDWDVRSLGSSQGNLSAGSAWDIKSISGSQYDIHNTGWDTPSMHSDASTASSVEMPREGAAHKRNPLLRHSSFNVNSSGPYQGAWVEPPQATARLPGTDMLRPPPGILYDASASPEQADQQLNTYAVEESEDASQWADATQGHSVATTDGQEGQQTLRRHSHAPTSTNMSEMHVQGGSEQRRSSVMVSSFGGSAAASTGVGQGSPTKGGAGRKDGSKKSKEGSKTSKLRNLGRTLLRTKSKGSIDAKDSSTVGSVPDSSGHGATDQTAMSSTETKLHDDSTMLSGGKEVFTTTHSDANTTPSQILEPRSDANASREEELNFGNYASLDNVERVQETAPEIEASDQASHSTLDMQANSAMTAPRLDTRSDHTTIEGSGNIESDKSTTPRVSQLGRSSSVALHDRPPTYAIVRSGSSRRHGGGTLGKPPPIPQKPSLLKMTTIVRKKPAQDGQPSSPKIAQVGPLRRGHERATLGPIKVTPPKVGLATPTGARKNERPALLPKPKKSEKRDSAAQDPPTLPLYPLYDRLITTTNESNLPLFPLPSNLHNADEAGSSKLEATPLPPPAEVITAHEVGVTMSLPPPPDDMITPLRKDQTSELGTKPTNVRPLSISAEFPAPPAHFFASPEPPAALPKDEYAPSEYGLSSKDTLKMVETLPKSPSVLLYTSRHFGDRGTVTDSPEWTPVGNPLSIKLWTLARRATEEGLTDAEWTSLGGLFRGLLPAALLPIPRSPTGALLSLLPGVPLPSNDENSVWESPAGALDSPAPLRDSSLLGKWGEATPAPTSTAPALPRASFVRNPKTSGRSTEHTSLNTQGYIKRRHKGSMADLWQLWERYVAAGEIQGPSELMRAVKAGLPSKLVRKGKMRAAPSPLGRCLLKHGVDVATVLLRGGRGTRAQRAYFEATLEAAARAHGHTSVARKQRVLLRRLAWEAALLQAALSTTGPRFPGRFLPAPFRVPQRARKSAEEPWAAVVHELAGLRNALAWRLARAEQERAEQVRASHAAVLKQAPFAEKWSALCGPPRTADLPVALALGLDTGAYPVYTGLLVPAIAELADQVSPPVAALWDACLCARSTVRVATRELPTWLDAVVDGLMHTASVNSQNVVLARSIWMASLWNILLEDQRHTAHFKALGRSFDLAFTNRAHPDVKDYQGLCTLSDTVAQWLIMYVRGGDIMSSGITLESHLRATNAQNVHSSQSAVTAMVDSINLDSLKGAHLSDLNAAEVPAFRLAMEGTHALEGLLDDTAPDDVGSQRRKHTGLPAQCWRRGAPRFAVWTPHSGLTLMGVKNATQKPKMKKPPPPKRNLQFTVVSIPRQTQLAQARSQRAVEPAQLPLYNWN